jgi:hypothetical protein
MSVEAVVFLAALVKEVKAATTVTIAAEIFIFKIQISVLEETKENELSNYNYLISFYIRLN